MDRSKSHLYKKKSAVDGVDKRVLRAHQKTVEQKTRRDETVQKRRNIQCDAPARKTPARDKAVSRKEMLLKWREERELKRKLESKDSRKPGFKVTKVEHQDKELFVKNKASKSATTASKTVTQKPAKPKVTKSKTSQTVQAAAPKPEVTKRQTRSTTSAASRATRSNAKSKPEAPVKNTRKGKENVQKAKEAATTTRTSRRAASQKSKESSSTDSESSSSEPCRFNAKTIRVGRGEAPSQSGTDSESFAPADFVFTAPATVKPFVLKPLSPTSAARFFSGTDSSEEERVPAFHSPVRTSGSVIQPPAAESSFQPMSFYGNKENKTPKLPSPAAIQQRRKSIRKSLSASGTSASETEGKGEVTMSAKSRRKSSMTVRSVDSPRKSTRRSMAPKTGAKENTEENVGAVEKAGEGTSAMEKMETDTTEKATEELNQNAVSEGCDTVDNVDPICDNQNSENKKDNSMAESFQSPVAPASCGRVTTSAKKDTSLVDNFTKTPVPLPRSNKKFRRSTSKTLARLKSPEERMECLAQSPMIEMVRRTPKSPVDRFLPAFDEEDFLGPPPPMASMEEAEETPAETALAQPVASPSTTQEETSVPANTEPEHDVKYFRALMVTETDRLNGLSATWDEINEKTSGLNEDVRGQIRTTTGQAHLLIAQRFKQFNGLVDNCEFNTGIKPVDCTDLQGFWDMVFFQVEDVNNKFQNLEKLKASGWVMDKPKVKKVLKKKTTTAGGKPAAKPTARSKFAQFRAKMKQQELPSSPQVVVSKPVTPKIDKTKPITPRASAKKPTSEVAEPDPAELKTFEGGFFQVASPVRVTAPTPTDSPKPTGNTSGEGTSLMKAALSNSAKRRSVGVVSEMPRSLKKARQSLGVPSPLLPGCMAERPSPRNTASPMLASRSQPFPREKTPVLECTVSKTSSTTPALEALRLDDSLSSGDDHKRVASPRKTPGRKSSARKTPGEKAVKFSCSSDEMDVDQDFVSKYCMPTIQESAAKEALPVVMEVDPFEPTITDEEMPGQMKRDLKGEFDKHSKSAEKTTKRRSVTSALKSSKKTPAASRRRSVRFVQSPGVSEVMAAPLPRTPFNRDSVVPQRRRSSRLSSSSDVGSSTPRPTKPWSGDLMMDSPIDPTGAQSKAPGDLLFTPVELTSAAPSVSDLICFSPVPSDQTPKRRKVESGRRKSSRLSSRSGESLL